MVKKGLSLKELQSLVTREKSKAKTIVERRKLEKELKDLRAGTNTKLLKRLGRGFVILTKKGAKATGRGIVAARKFAEESGAGEGFENIRFRSALNGDGKSVGRKSSRVVIVRTKVIKSKPKKRRRRVTVIRTRKIIRRPRQRSTSDSGFFGGLSDLGI
jgi:hypothetical protein